jgi:hypothetical protein
MLAKLTSKNQLTIPAELLRKLPEAEYFDATVEDDAIVLRPVRVAPAVDLERIRERMEAAGVTEDDVKEAVRWARRKR